MKRYTTPRPQLTTYVQWDGTNINEFEALTGQEWPWLWFNDATYVDNEGDLEIWLGEQLMDTIPNGWWSSGPGNAIESLETGQSETIVDGSPPFQYIVTTT